MNQQTSYNELEKQWNPLLNKFSQRYVIPGYDQDDIMQELRMTLMRANELYDPNKSKFITYLYSALNSKCKQLYRDVQGRQKHIPHNMISFIGESTSLRSKREEFFHPEQENIDLLTGLTTPALKISSLIIGGKTKRKDWLAAGMTKDEVRIAQEELKLALNEGRK